MEEKRDLWDVLFAPICIVSAFIFYLLRYVGSLESMLEIVYSYISLATVLGVWVSFAYSYAKKKVVSTVFNPLHHFIAIVLVSLLVTLLLLFLDCCFIVIGSSLGNIVDMIQKAPVYFIKSFAIPVVLLKLGFWFLYCCFICYLVHVGEKNNWIQKVARCFGIVFSEDIAQIQKNALVMPWAYGASKAKLYFAVNGKGMLLTEEEFAALKEYTQSTIQKEPDKEEYLQFMELLDNAIDLSSEDGKTFTFDSVHLEKFKWEHYEVQEESGWCELLPIHLAEPDETKKKEKPLWRKLFSLSFLVPLLLFSMLTYKLIAICQMGYVSLYGDLFSGLKYVSYVSLMVLVACVCNWFIVKKDSSKTKKILTCALSALMLLILIILLNNVYHFLEFGYRFNWPKGVSYWMFVRDDIVYHHSVGVLRFPAVVLLYLGIYFFQYRQIAKKWGGILKEALLESLTSDKE